MGSFLLPIIVNVLAEIRPLKKTGIFSDFTFCVKQPFSQEFQVKTVYGIQTKYFAKIHILHNFKKFKITKFGNLRFLKFLRFKA